MSLESRPNRASRDERSLPQNRKQEEWRLEEGIGKNQRNKGNGASGAQEAGGVMSGRPRSSSWLGLRSTGGHKGISKVKAEEGIGSGNPEECVFVTASALPKRA
ncbi:hypothetical protein BKA70DRAFT_1220469 [Coprinopsis sp. MPI-PUGE-AT-0042]|nr:hypothetical protein BKA70DRAFT_1220469 [Coprinopsis sp. MPI-PUGE-AT-0042]